MEGGAGMKRAFLFFLIAVFAALASGCQGETGLDYSLSGIEAGSGSLFWETEDAYYTVYTMYTADASLAERERETDLEAFGQDGTPGELGERVGAYLYRSSKEDLDWQPVCPNESCPHTGIYCGARLSGGTISFGIYNNSIYFTSFSFVGEEEVGLFRMDMDGGNRELVAALPCESGWVYGGLYHKGYYLYYQYHLEQDGSAMEEKIYVYPLQGGGELELILEEPMAEDLAGYRLYPLEDTVYFVRKNRQETVDISCYDLKKKTWETKVTDGISSHIWSEEEGCFFIKKGEGVFYMDWEEGELSLLIQAHGEEGTWYFDGTYFYETLAAWKQAEIGETMKIYDRTGKLVQEISYPVRQEFAQAGILVSDDQVRAQYLLPGNFENLYYWGTTEDKVLFSREVTSEMPTWYLEKDKIGTDKLEWKAGITQIERPQDITSEWIIKSLEEIKKLGLGQPIS